MRKASRAGRWLLVLGLCGCGSVAPRSTPSPATDRSTAQAWNAPSLDVATSVRDGRTGERMAFDEFLDRLTAADAVFLGETHTDETTHRVELGVFAGLAARKPDVVLAMEMFERDAQPIVDDYLAGRIDEAAFRAQARPWSNYQTAYRPLIEHAKAIGAPVVASNFPTSLRRRMASEGAALLATLEGDEARQAPAELMPNTPAYWKRVDNAIRGHIGMMPAREEGDQRLTSTQTLWDNSMGEACALALDAHPGGTVVHVNGGFHSAYWDGTVRQFKLRRPNAKVATIAIVPDRNPSVAELGGAPVADYVVFATQRAVDTNDGAYSLYTERKVEYLLHVPESASPDARVPLLIWIPDRGLTAADGMELLKARFGDEAAIAVLAPTYREMQDDLSVSGRWYWSDTFMEDASSLAQAVNDVWGFVARYHAIDPARTALAGEGDGATVVAIVSLLDGSIGVNGVAFAPRDYKKIQDMPLPLPELQGDDTPPVRTLRVFGGESDEAWWGSELEQYASIGFDATFARTDPSVWSRERTRENALRRALELEAKASAAASDTREFIAVSGDSMRETYWARLYALRRAQATGASVAVVVGDDPETAQGTRLDLTPRAADFAEGDALPKCPGPFGGTTVVVLPDSTPDDQVAAWFALEENDPLTARSRFLRTRIAVGTEGERSLENVLVKLVGERRTNILIVPGAFCANGDTMRALSRSVDAVDGKATLHWMPGLGPTL